MTVQTMLPRGIRNHNPLNIRFNPENRWQGRVPPKHNSDGAFEQFEDPVMGLRAAAVLLIAHYDRRHLDTLRKLVQMWAPPNENDTEAYARCVAKASGFGIDEPLDLHDHACLRPILTHDPSRERPPALYRRSDRGSTGARGRHAASALAAADADGEGWAGGRRRHHGRCSHRRRSGDDRPGARGARGGRTVPRCGQVGTPRGHADRLGVMLWARVDDRRMGLR